MNFLIFFFQEKFECAVRASVVFKENPDKIDKIWQAIASDMYNLSARRKQLGLEDQVRLHCQAQ